MDYNHLPDCKHPYAPIDVCGCEVKILKAKVEELEDVKERLSIDIMVLEKQLKDALHLLFKSEDA